MEPIPLNLNAKTTIYFNNSDRISSTARFLSSAPKMAVPATTTFAPAAAASLVVLESSPPSTWI
jgi:hypothetical protein